MNPNNSIELYKSRVDRLLDDISVKYTKLDAKPGDIIIVQPNSSVCTLTPTFKKFIAGEFYKFIPEGVKVLIIEDPNIKFFVETTK